MQEGMWYQFLLEEGVTMEEIDGQTKTFIPCRAEKSSISTNWEISWYRARLRGLGSEVTSFLFKLLHQLLVTQERLARTNPKTSPLCKAPGCPGSEVEDLNHALISCPSNGGAGRAVINCVAIFTPGMTDQQALRLEFPAEESSELAVTWVLGMAFFHIWEVRRLGKRPELFTIRADLESKVSLLRQARRFNNDIILIRSMLDQL